MKFSCGLKQIHTFIVMQKDFDRYVIEVLISIKLTRTKKCFLLYENGGYMYICNVYLYQMNGNSNFRSVKRRANPFPICDWSLITQFRKCRLIHLICRKKKTPSNIKCQILIRFFNLIKQNMQMAIDISNTLVGR